MLAGMASTMAQGFAFGTGSSIAHRYAYGAHVQTSKTSMLPDFYFGPDPLSSSPEFCRVFDCCPWTLIAIRCYAYQLFSSLARPHTFHLWSTR